VPVKSGDVVVLATDGLFDNMPEQVALLTMALLTMALLTMALLTMASSTTCPSRWAATTVVL
jgi:serine/threonine protein phosphatase PrpC